MLVMITALQNLYLCMAEAYSNLQDTSQWKMYYKYLKGYTGGSNLSRQPMQ